MPPTTLHRIEVRAKPGQADPKGDAASRDAAALNLESSPGRVDHADVYFIEGALTERQLRRLAGELLADPVTQQFWFGADPARADALIEVHPLPGVMDPVAQAVQIAIQAMLGLDVRVQTGQRFDLHGIDDDTARIIAERCLANPVIQAIHSEPYQPDALPAGTGYELKILDVPICDLDDAGLARLSRDGHLFLSVAEMKAVQVEYRRLGREPREIELETLAQTWSEHCVHKTLKSTIRYREGDTLDSPTLDWAGRPGHEDHKDGSVTIHNLLKSTVAAATHELIDEDVDWCLSVFVDNAGIIAFDEDHAVCFKVETHNHPSAIEPYGGAATGIGGCIRDIIGTGLAAKPIAATDIFCVAPPDMDDIPAGCLHPKRILSQVVAGVRDYGNRMGIPTLNGTVWFDEDYVGNPLVFCGCVGVMPRDRIEGDPAAGDRIIAMGGRTGRDGIHGATFSSAELTDTHAEEFSHAVQIGNPVTEKKLLDAILAARDHADGCLFQAITDCGAGGFSSAVGEMGSQLGAEVHLEHAPLKYDGLNPTEIWISEAQERMVLAVDPEKVARLQAICDLHDVEMCDLGHFGTADSELILNYEGSEVGRLTMAFLHEGIPSTTREAVWSREPVETPPAAIAESPGVGEALLKLLAHPNLASKRCIIRQYDHEVQGGSVIKPLVGTRGEGPSDAAVILPVPGSTRGLSIANGLATGLRDDPYVMTLAAIDECVRNLVCVGTDPTRIAILDNFGWPSCDDPRNLGDLVRAAEACYDGAKAYRTPFISGKDSLHNQFTTEDGRTIQIPPTLLISGFGIVPDVRRCVTMDAKKAGNQLVIVGRTTEAMGGSHYARLFGGVNPSLPAIDLKAGPKAAASVHAAIHAGVVRSAHDCSEGGVLAAAAEMAFAGGLGLHLDLAALPGEESVGPAARGFAETPGRYLMEVHPDDLHELRMTLAEVPHAIIGEFNGSDRLTLADDTLNVSVDELFDAWLNTLSW